MKPLLIIKTGTTFTDIRRHYGDFEHWIGRGLGTPLPTRVVDIANHAILPTPSAVAGVVITGSHAMVTERLPWMQRLARWLRTAFQDYRNVPVLGICFGHQILAQALGGTVADNPLGMEAGTVAIHLAPMASRDPLLGGMLERPWAQVVHRQSVLTLPDDAMILASNARDACQAFRWGERVWGVQFHPEFSADVMRAYLQALRTEGLGHRQVDSLLPLVRECQDATAILRRFARLALADAA